VDRIIDAFPEESQEQARGAFSVLVKGVLAQQLCKKANGDGRIAAIEILLQTYAVSNMIRENKVHLIDGYLQSVEHDDSGMQSLDRALFHDLREGLITVEEAVKVANYPDNLRKLAETLVEDA
jgi:twitching motility protein PilT